MIDRMIDRGSRRAQAERLLAAGLLTFFCLAACATLRLVAAEWMFRHGRMPAFAASAAYWDAWADRAPTRAQVREALRSAVTADPRDSAAWISLGLAAEGAGELAEAARDFETAEQVDRQYLPAWSAANFFFRHGDTARFWPAAAHAAAMAYDDLAPLIDLADRMEPDPVAALSRLGQARSLERAYLDFLIVKGRWAGAQSIAWKLEAHHDPLDAERLLGFVDRLLAAERGAEALALCRKIANCPVPAAGAASALANGNFQFAPAGHGFDWRVKAPPTVGPEWQSGRMGFRLSGSEPDQYSLLEQPVLVVPRRYCLRFEFRIPGAGLRWVADQDAASGQISPAYAGAEDRREWRKAEWFFTPARAGLARLRLIYRREPGSLPATGRAGVRNLSLEIL